MLTRAIDERAKPNGERIAAFRDSAKESLELELFSTEPVYDDYEILRLTDSLTDFAEKFGAQRSVGEAGSGRQIAARPRESNWSSGTKLKDVEFRKDLYGKRRGGVAGRARSNARSRADDRWRRLGKLAKPMRRRRKSSGKRMREIAKARFAIEGTSNYPDATFTLRLSYGKVLGYEEDGKQIPPFTDFAGLYQRAAEHDNQPPFDLPHRWIERKAQLNLATKFNFVSDADIIGGNSGSPVVNKANEFVGIIFDGNIQSLVLDCIFSDKQARAVSVDSAAISEALRKVYDASPLADELEGGK